MKNDPHPDFTGALLNAAIEAKKKVKYNASYYSRVSIDDEDRKEYTSCEVQRDQCSRLIDSHNTENWLLTLPLEDIGYSGATSARPGFQRLLRAVVAHEIDAVVVYHTDRISRSVPDYLNFLELLKKHGVRLVSITQTLDSEGAVGEFNTIVHSSRSMADMAVSTSLLTGN